MRRMTLYAVSATLGSVVQVLVLLVGTSHFGMMFVATTSAIFYVVIDTIMLISLRKHLGQIGLKSMVFAFVRSILFGLAGSAAALLIMVGLRVGIGVPDGRALYGVLYCIFAGIPAVLVTYGLAILFKSPRVCHAAFTGISRKVIAWPKSGARSSKDNSQNNLDPNYDLRGHQVLHRHFLPNLQMTWYPSENRLIRFLLIQVVISGKMVLARLSM